MNDHASKAIASEETARWQNRLLPFMQLIILLLGLFFFIATLYQLYSLNEDITSTPTLNAEEVIHLSDKESTLIEKQWTTLIILETHVLKQRYHQANVLLLARIWVRYLGFITGMILAVIGAVFILGKLREPETNIEGTVQDSNFKISSQSPGIILVTLGTILMLVTILVHHEIEVNDNPVYTVIDMGGSAEPTKAPSPKPLDLTQSDDPAASTGEEKADAGDALLEAFKNGLPIEEADK